MSIERPAAYPELEQLNDKALEKFIRRQARILGMPSRDLDELEAAAIAEAHELLTQLAWMGYHWPLSLARLWVNEDEAADQRRAVLAMYGMMCLLVLGGNRSGKSYAGKQLAVAMALGGDHPQVMAWLEENDLPADLIPDGPADVFVVAQSGADSVRYHRDDLAALLPPDARWRNRNVAQEAIVEVEVPNYHRKARIFCKSVDQKHRSFKGAECRFILIDEEPEGEEGRLVFEECMRATSSQAGGGVMLTFTPQSGFTWTYEELVVGHKYGCKVIELDTLHNTMVDDPEGVRRWIESMSEEEALTKRFGRFVDLRGVVYPEFTRGDGSREGPGNLCDPFEIPEEWPRFIGVDWGFKDPTAVVWCAIGDDGTVFVYREHKQAGLSWVEHAQTCHHLMGNKVLPDGTIDEKEPLEGGWADSSHPKAIDQWGELDIELDFAEKNVLTGLDAVRALLKLWPDGRPRLKIFTHCADLIHELQNYRWNPKVKSPAPIKKNDHLLDALRYCIMGIREWNEA